MAEYSQTKAIKRHGAGWAVLPQRIRIGNSEIFTGLAVGVRGSVGLFPETVLEGVWFSLLCSARQSGFRILWLSLKRLLIA